MCVCASQDGVGSGEEAVEGAEEEDGVGPLRDDDDFDDDIPSHAPVPTGRPEVCIAASVLPSPPLFTLLSCVLLCWCVCSRMRTSSTRYSRQPCTNQSNLER